jgi:hypothetical protein
MAKFKELNQTLLKGSGGDNFWDDGWGIHPVGQEQKGWVYNGIQSVLTKVYLDAHCD